MRASTVLAVFVAACGGGSLRVPPPDVSAREIGELRLGELRVRLVSEKSVVARNPCEQTFLRSRPCTDAEIWTHLEVTLAGESITAVSLSPSWDGRERYVVAERDTGSFDRVRERAEDRLARFRVVSCQDATRIAYRIDTGDEDFHVGFSVLSRTEGLVLGGFAPESVTRCEDALAHGARLEAELARDAGLGVRRVFDAYVRGGAVVSALDFALAHPFEVDVLRESHPPVDARFLTALEARAATDATLARAVHDAVVAREASYPAGRRGSQSLGRFIRRLVRALPATHREAIARELSTLCGTATCAPWRYEAMAEASLSLDIEARCVLGAPFVEHAARTPGADREAVLLALTEGLAGCPASTELAAAILRAPGAFPVNDGAFLYPPCIDAVGTMQTITRCGSAPTYAVLEASEPCAPALLHAAGIAGASNARPWQLAALAVYVRCGRIAERDALVDRLRPTDPFREDGVRQAMDHTFPRPAE